MTIKTMQDLANKHAPLPSAKIPTKKERAKNGITIKSNKKLTEPVKANPLSDCGLTAKQLQDKRNSEYFRKLNAGEIEELPPFPNAIASVIIRDGVFDEPI
jgi:hypothetical protein